MERPPLPICMLRQIRSSSKFNDFKTIKRQVITFVALGLLLMMKATFYCHPALALSGVKNSGYDLGDSSHSSSKSSLSYSHGYDDVFGCTCKRPKGKEWDELSQIEKITSTIFCILVVTGSSYFIYLCFKNLDADSISVVKLQVGLFGEIRPLQTNLDQVCKTTETSNPDGWNHILKSTTSILVEDIDLIFSTHLSANITDDGKKQFLENFLHERRKLQQISRAKRKAVNILSSDEYMVVTILVATREIQKLPTINKYKDLKEVLKILQDIPSNNLQGVLVIWTPQKVNDVLSKEMLKRKFPDLRHDFKE